MRAEQTLWDLLNQRCEQSPRAAFCEDELGRNLSFGDLRQAALETGQAFHDLGIRENDRVAWQLPTWQESVVLSLALSLIGAVQIPLFPTLREKELLHICTMARPKLLLSPSTFNGHDFGAMARRVQSQLRDKGVDMDTGTVDRGHLPVSAPGRHWQDRGQQTPGELPVRWIFCTSGTTSVPKAAMHTDTPFVTVGYAMNALLEVCSSDVVPIFFPFTHVGGLMWLASSLLAGNRLLLADSFGESAIRFASERGTTIGGAGTVFHLAYLQAQRTSPSIPLFPAIRSFTGGGAPKPPDLHYEMKEIFGGAGIVSGYGLTECPIISMNSVRDPDDRLAHSEGRLLPGMQVRIVDPDGAACVEGEIRVKGPHLCRGFLDPELNKRCFDEEGYFKTGDIGRLDKGGWLTISGRLKDVIIRKGENISAKKIEDLLYEHPAVRDVAVVGLPDKIRGELACAVVELQEGCEAITLQAVRDYCLANGLVIQEVPERLELLSQLPRNSSGKVLKTRLREQFS